MNQDLPQGTSKAEVHAVQDAANQNSPSGAVRFECAGSGGVLRIRAIPMIGIFPRDASVHGADEELNGFRRLATESVRQTTQQLHIK